MQQAQSGVAAPDEVSHRSNGLRKPNVVCGPGIQREGIRIGRGLPHQGWSTRAKQMLWSNKGFTAPDDDNNVSSPNLQI